MTRTREKMPAIQMYSGDWKKDPCVQKCSLAARGLWFEFLLAMHENSRSGFISGTHRELARLAGCDSSEVAELIDELSACDVCDVERTEGPTGTICHITNRRMSRESHEREKARKRKQKQRSGDDVTPMSQNGHADVRGCTSVSPSKNIYTDDPRAHEIPDDLNIDTHPRMREFAIRQGIPVDGIPTLFERFRSHYKANGRRFIDWEHKWREWCLSPHNDLKGKKHRKSGSARSWVGEAADAMGYGDT